MNLRGQVIYLERDPTDSALKFPSDFMDGSSEYYQVGGLYIQSDGPEPWDSYSARAQVGEDLIFDTLVRSAALGPGIYLYTLQPSTIPSPIVRFLAIREVETGREFRNLWRLEEEDPVLLDRLQELHQYNILGVTDRSDDREDPGTGVLPTPPGLGLRASEMRTDEPETGLKSRPARMPLEGHS